VKKTTLLFLNVFVLATCGLVYELLCGTLASYVLGDSVTQFSLVIGLYLSAMGVGAWASRKIASGLAERFIEVELAVAVVGGLSAPLLLFAFARVMWFKPALYGEVFLIGVLVGLELPLLMRLLKSSVEFKDLVARVFTFDYAGALLASVAFPLFFVPRLGLVRTSLAFGLANAAVALWGTWLLAPALSRSRIVGLRVRGALVAAALVGLFVDADQVSTMAEDQLFADDVVYSKTTPYQRIVMTHNHAGFQLFLNGNLQFSSADEYRYHEALVHPAFAVAGAAQRKAETRVLVLGGGDGLAVREILRHPEVANVDLVDLDPDMTALGDRFALLGDLAKHSLHDPRVTVHNADAMAWLEERNAAGDRAASEFDVAIVDFPDPNNFALGKLYTSRFYKLLSRRLAEDGAVVVQATSPMFARTSYWCIVRTMEAAGLVVRPYHTAVPSFGEWGFVLAKKGAFDVPTHAPEGLRYLNDETLASLFQLSVDLGPVPVEVNRLDNQMLVRYYESEWKKYQ
jgi:spermidine synthase